MSDESEALKESAKAVQEIAKASGKAIDAGREAGGWIGRVIGYPIEQASSYIADRVKTKRIEAAIYDFEKLELLRSKVERKLEKRGVKVTRPVSPKVVIPIIEHATMEDEDDLHTLYANLMVTAQDAAAKEVHRKYVSTLAELTRRDVEVLEALYKGWLPLDKEWNRSISSLVEYSPGIDTNTHDQMSVVTLNRLGIVEPNLVGFLTYRPDETSRWDRSSHEMGEAIVPGDLTVVAFTAFGEAFCEALFEK